MATLDIRMNDFTPATDGKYIYAEDADGNQVKIKKTDLIELIRIGIGIATVAQNGLLENTDLFYKGLASGKTGDLESGIYGIFNSSLSNLPIIYGTIVVFGTKGQYYGFWIALSSDANDSVIYRGIGNSYKKINLV